MLALADPYPITPKEHGTAFLMQHRHLWLRSSRQRAALRVRSEVEQAIRDFYYERGYTLIDSPILTPAACEGTATLFSTAAKRTLQCRHRVKGCMRRPSA